MSDKNLFWVALGGNNKTYAGGNANLVFSSEEGKVDDLSDSILIDFGNCYYGPEFSLSKFVMPDLDFLFPSVESDEQPIPKAIFLTHDHADHLEGLVHFLLRGRKMPPIYASPFTLDILKTRLASHGFTDEIETVPVKPEEMYTVNGWRVTPFNVSHSTAECLGFFVEKDNKNFLHLGDFKNDSTVLLGPKTDYSFLKMVEENEEIDAVLLDGIFGGRDISVDDEHIRESIRNEFRLNEGKRIIFGFYGGYLEMAASLMAVAAENDYAVVIGSTLLENRLNSLEKTRKSIVQILQDQTWLPGIENLKVYVDGDEALQHIDKNKTIVLTDLVQTDPKSFLGRLFSDTEKALRELDENDSIYVTGTVIKYGGYGKVFKTFADQLHEKGIHVCYKESGRFMDAVGHASWIGISTILNITKPKTAVFIYGRENDLKETFNRASFFENKMNLANPNNGEVYQIVPYLSEPVAKWGEAWIEPVYLPGSLKPAYHKKPKYKP